MIDLKLDTNHDLIFKDGDLVTTEDLNTSILTALFSNRDKVWFLNDDLEGSYLYKANQKRLNSSILKDIRMWVYQALEYLTEFDLVKDFTVKVLVDSNGVINLIITILNADNVTENYSYQL